MALDGFFLSAYTQQLKAALVGAKIDKIYQIGSDLILHFRGRQSGKLRLSADATHPRILITDEKIEAPEKPPMFCMLLRKHLTGGIIADINQVGLERIITLQISARNDFGDKTDRRLIIEIMGKHANIILVGDQDRVIDSIKRVNPHMSPRPIGPGTLYGPPPTQKLDLNALSPELLEAFGNTSIQKCLYSKFSGVSPSLSHSMLALAKIDGKTPANQLSDSESAALLHSIATHLKALKTPQPYIYHDPTSQQIVDFSSIPLYHLRMQADSYSESTLTSFDSLLGLIYQKTNDANRLLQKSSHLIKLIALLQERLVSKIANLEGDLEAASSLETQKLWGELLTANLHAIKKGMTAVTVTNYYTGESLEIPLDPTKGPNENAQRYYKRYSKAKTTLEEAKNFIHQAEEDHAYLDAVLQSLLQAELPEDVDSIKEELAEQGFIKASTLRKQGKIKKAPPYRYRATEGTLILVGRNNLQNDQLTLKDSHREHIWLHAKDVPGSHVIIQASFPEIEEGTLIEAANIAAYHSRARQSSQVAIDFTEVKYVKKPRGAKPGMVIYEDFKTIYVTPDAQEVLALRVDTTHQKTP